MQQVFVWGVWDRGESWLAREFRIEAGHYRATNQTIVASSLGELQAKLRGLGLERTITFNDRTSALKEAWYPA